MNADSGIDAAISAFIRHNELGSIKYEGKDNLISMEMILKGYTDDNQKQKFTHNIYQSLALFYKLRKIEIKKLNISFISQSDITILTLTRDDETISEDEIDLYVSLATIEFSSVLMIDTNEQLPKFQYAFKKNLLEKINSKWSPDQRIIAYRDRGKMFVFE